MDNRRKLKDDNRASWHALKFAILCVAICGISAVVAARGHVHWPPVLSVEQLPLILTAASTVFAVAHIFVAHRSSAKQLAATSKLNDLITRVAADLMEIHKSTESTAGLHEVMERRDVDAATARRQLRASANRDGEFAAYVVCSVLSALLAEVTTKSPPALRH